MSTEPAPPQASPDKIDLTLDDLFQRLPEIADAIDSARVEGIALGLAMAWGHDRAEAVLAGLRGEDPGGSVPRQVRSRDLITVRRNIERMREG